MLNARLGALGSALIITLLGVSHGACTSSDEAPVDGGATPDRTQPEPPRSDAGPTGDAEVKDADASDAHDAAPPPVCGDGVIEGDEECEDGNTAGGDGCDVHCHLEHGYECPTIRAPCMPTTCGDGQKRGTEDCDDGNHDWGDTCTPLCTLAPSCTDGVCTPICGDGIVSAGEDCDDGNKRPFDGCSTTCTVEPGFTCAPGLVEMPIVHRDFRGYDLPADGALPRGHIDFENATGTETGIVAATLGADGKPIYAKDGVSSATTHGKTAFDQWFRDVPGVNVTVLGGYSLTHQGGAYEFSASAYFPLDAAGYVLLGQEPKRSVGGGTQRNFSFTSETRIWLVYSGTELVDVRGDDDIWVFINGRLAIDLGGVHAPANGRITLSQKAVELGNLTVNGIYEMALFRAERHTTQSSFQVQLTSPPVMRSVCTQNAL